MTTEERIEEFLNGDTHAVVGASRDKSKIGNRVLLSYLQNGRRALPVNPGAEEIEGVACYPDLASLPTKVHGVSVITPPAVAEKIVEQAAAAGVKNIWFQPGAESEKAVQQAQELGMNVIAGGPCILVVLGYKSTAN